MSISLQDISIRTKLKAGDIGHVIKIHGLLYEEEHNYGIEFESYVAAGLSEFYKNYNRDKDCLWIAEYKDEIAGFLLLMHRENNSAQLRYFIITPHFRGIGLGKKMMDLFFVFLKSSNYKTCYLWTTSELNAAATLYTRYGFQLTEQVQSSAFGKPVTQQRYDWTND